MSGFSSKRCPVSAAIILAMREAFGEDCKVLAVRENGFEHDPERRIKSSKAQPTTEAAVTR